MIHYLLQLFIYIIIADVILSYFPDVRRQQWAQVLHKIADAPQRPIREMLPKDIPLDPSPMIIIILIQILMYIL
ncbi:YggT family protein [Peredibacter sp. HCB2-198]|uniref:YggT family protein n=1 Tax=Peredibacter sp. HCB2-198 TaxID=3383025 RepID=UPI0038B5F179